jgi:hypothetical protein
MDIKEAFLVLPAVEERLAYLYLRWQDEKEYEDWRDYVKELAKLAGPGFVSASQQPFGFVTRPEGARAVRVSCELNKDDDLSISYEEL